MEIIEKRNEFILSDEKQSVNTQDALLKVNIISKNR